MEAPTPKEILKFLAVCERLQKFEAEHYAMKKWGAFAQFERDEFPIPEVVKVHDWLDSMVQEVLPKNVF